MRNLLNIILTILKASSWGVLLFLIVCFVILEAWIAYLNISSIKPLSVIKDSLENDCPNCGLSLDSFYNPYMDNEIDIDHLKKTLERLSIKKNIITFNIIKYLSLLISSIAILLGIYLVSVLFSYKKITAQGMVVIFF